jgi:hypothetical protein
MFNNEQLTFTICELARFKGWPYPADYSVINSKINYVASKDKNIVVARNLDQGEWEDIHPKDKRVIASRAAYETLRVFFKYDKAEPVRVIGDKFNSDGSVTITLSQEVTLRNGTNSFEVFVNGEYTRECEVSVDGNVLTVTAAGIIEKVRYGYDCEMTDEIKEDVSKMVTVYDVNGFPLDLFVIIESDDPASGDSIIDGGSEPDNDSTEPNDKNENTDKNEDNMPSDKEGSKENGCNGSVTASLMSLVILGGTLILKKKKENIIE